MTTRRLQPPAPRKTAHRSNPPELPPKVRAELRELLPRSMTDDEAKRFLDRAAGSFNEADSALRRGLPPASDTRRRLQKIATRARALQQAIAALDETGRSALDASAIDIVSRSAADRLSELADALRRLELPCEIVAEGENDLLMMATWHLAADIGRSAEHAAAWRRGSRQTKPKQHLARMLIAAVARQYRAVTGRPPPTGAATWFACLMATLGDELGLPIGARLTREALLMQRQRK